MLDVDIGRIDVAGASLEYRRIGPSPTAAPTIVLLHGGLGCVSTWRDFPERLAVEVFDRQGRGADEGPLDFDLRRSTGRVLSRWSIGPFALAPTPIVSPKLAVRLGTADDRGARPPRAFTTGSRRAGL